METKTGLIQIRLPLSEYEEVIKWRKKNRISWRQVVLWILKSKPTFKIEHGEVTERKKK